MGDGMTASEQLVYVKTGKNVKEFLEEQRSAGKSYRSIAAELGISKTLVANWCHKYLEESN